MAFNRFASGITMGLETGPAPLEKQQGDDSSPLREAGLFASWRDSGSPNMGNKSDVKQLLETWVANGKSHLFGWSRERTFDNGLQVATEWDTKYAMTAPRYLWPGMGRADIVQYTFSADGKTVTAKKGNWEQSGKASFNKKTGVLTLDLEQGGELEARQIQIDTNGTFTEITKEKGKTLYCEYSADGKYQTITTVSKDGQIDTKDQNILVLKPGEQVKAPDGTVITFPGFSVKAERKDMGSWVANENGETTVQKKDGIDYSVYAEPTGQLGRPVGSTDAEGVIHPQDSDYFSRSSIYPPKGNMEIEGRSLKLISLELPQYDGAVLKVKAYYDVNEQRVVQANLLYKRSANG